MLGWIETVSVVKDAFATVLFDLEWLIFLASLVWAYLVAPSISATRSLPIQLRVKVTDKHCHKGVRLAPYLDETEDVQDECYVDCSNSMLPLHRIVRIT